MNVDVDVCIAGNRTHVLSVCSSLLQRKGFGAEEMDDH